MTEALDRLHLSGPREGDEFSVVYPFVRAEYDWYDDEGPIRLKTWRPGISVEVGDYGDTDEFADSEGQMILTVVAVFKPGRFPRRVFFTRQFVDPDGKTFGKGGLQIVTLEKFRRIATRYSVPYDCEELFEQAAERRALASVDTRPEDGDALAAPLASGAVPKADAHNNPVISKS